MAWCRPGDKPLFEPMVFMLLTHISVTRPQWVNKLNIGIRNCVPRIPITLGTACICLRVSDWMKIHVTGPCITNVFATCRKNFSQWERSFLWKLRCHWLKFLRRVAKTLVIQGPGSLWHFCYAYGIDQYVNEKSHNNNLKTWYTIYLSICLDICGKYSSFAISMVNIMILGQSNTVNVITFECKCICPVRL